MAMTYPLLPSEKREDPEASLISYAVRMKLDLCGLRISLETWQALDRPSRRLLHDAPGETDADLEAFRGRLEACLEEAGRAPAAKLAADKAARVAEWKDPGPLPPRLQADGRVPESLWRRLPRFGRYLMATAATRGEARLGEAIEDAKDLWPSAWRSRS